MPSGPTCRIRPGKLHTGPRRSEPDTTGMAPLRRPSVPAEDRCRPVRELPGTEGMVGRGQIFPGKKIVRGPVPDFKKSQNFGSRLRMGGVKLFHPPPVIPNARYRGVFAGGV